jgi:site-specific recombinase XerD
VVKIDEILKKLALELKIRGFSQKTIESYSLHSRLLQEFIKKPLEQTTSDDVKSYIAHLRDQGQKPSSINLAISSLKFLYKNILKTDILLDIRGMKKENKEPLVLNKEEITRLLDATKNLKHKMMFQLMYSSGLRVSEVINLKKQDFEISQGLIRVKLGKGKKDRTTKLADSLKDAVGGYVSNLKDTDYIFQNKKRQSPVTIKLAQKIIKNSAKKAGINKRVFCHMLRASFATHLHQSGVDSRTIQVLLGHSNLATTQRYTRVSLEQIKNIKSPIDEL